MNPIPYSNKLENNWQGHKNKIYARQRGLKVRDRLIPWNGRPLLMGILNINNDSFAGDGRLDANWALERAVEMVAEGADIIDVGGESARTNREAISEEEEIHRVRPFLEKFDQAMQSARPRGPTQVFPPLVSLNTWRPGVIEGCLKAGFDILNDMGALPGATNARLCARIGAALLIMHSQGEPKVSHIHVNYENVIQELMDFFVAKSRLAMDAGVLPESIILDPGIDFAKQKNDNLKIYRDLEKFHALGFPILLPISRKSVIGHTLGLKNPVERDAGTIACLVAGTLRGAAIFRVHNISAAWLGLRAIEAVA
jgi:dihydropteroate synthase